MDSRLAARSSDHTCLRSGSCSSGRDFAPRFLQTVPRGSALALRSYFTSIRLYGGLSPPSCWACPAHSLALRTNHRREAAYLYRLNTPADNARQLFLIYVKRINELADRPEFYHLLSNSCTINIIRYANAAGREGRFDIRHLFNGLIDSYLYHSGRVDTTLPFDELRQRSLIDEAAQAAEGAPDFSERIRESLPTIPR